MINRKTFCPAPWVHQNIETDGRIEICCSIKLRQNISPSGNPYNIHEHSLQDSWNGELTRKLRTQFLNDEEPSECFGCYNLEKYSNRSSRTSFNDQYTNDEFIEEIKSNTSRNGFYNKLPQDFQIQTGNLCNLACKMCIPELSNQVEKFYKRLENREQPINFLSTRNKIWHPLEDKEKYKWPETIGLNKIFDGMESSLTKIYLTGGEPTIIHENEEFLDNLLGWGLQDDIEIQISSNFTNTNQSFFDKILQFKHAKIIASLDGMDDIAYIQRFPSDWKTVEQNFEKVYNKIKENNIPTQSIMVSTAITAINLHHILDFWIWIFKKYPDLWISNNTIVFGDTAIDIVPKYVAKLLLSDLYSKKSLISEYCFDALEKILKNTQFNKSTIEMFELIDSMQRLHPKINTKETFKFYYDNIYKYNFLKIPGLWGNWTCSLLDNDSDVVKADDINFYYNNNSEKLINRVSKLVDYDEINLSIQTIEQIVHPNDIFFYFYCSFEKNDTPGWTYSVDNLAKELLYDDPNYGKTELRDILLNNVGKTKDSIAIEEFEELLIDFFYIEVIIKGKWSTDVSTQFIKNSILLYQHEYSNKEKLWEKLKNMVDRKRFDERYEILIETNNKYLTLYKSFINKLENNQNLTCIEKAFCFYILYNLNIKDTDIEQHKDKILEWAINDWRSRYEL